MAVRIRLRRVGRKKQPHYRIVVADSTSPRDGRFVEIIGHYHPRQAENSLEIQKDRANHWLDNGALPSDTVRSLLRRVGVLKARHEARLAKKLRIVSDTSPLARKADSAGRGKAAIVSSALLATSGSGSSTRIIKSASCS